MIRCDVCDNRVSYLRVFKKEKSIYNRWTCAYSKHNFLNIKPNLINYLFSDTDRRYRATEKLLHAEDEFREALCCARELYARPLARSHPEFHDVLFQPLADLAIISAELCRRVSYTTAPTYVAYRRDALIRLFSSLIPLHWINLANKTCCQQFTRCRFSFSVNAIMRSFRYRASDALLKWSISLRSNLFIILFFSFIIRRRLLNFLLACPWSSQVG